MDVKTDFYNLESKKNKSNLFLNKNTNSGQIETYENEKNVRTNYIRKIQDAKRDLMDINEKSNEVTKLLEGQSTAFKNIYKKNDENYHEITVADNKITSIERKKMCKVIILHCIAILLFFGIILVLLFKLFFR